MTVLPGDRFLPGVSLFRRLGSAGIIGVRPIGSEGEIGHVGSVARPRPDSRFVADGSTEHQVGARCDRGGVRHHGGPDSRCDHRGSRFPRPENQLNVLLHRQRHLHKGWDFLLAARANTCSSLVKNGCSSADEDGAPNPGATTQSGFQWGSSCGHMWPLDCLVHGLDWGE
jgi:hypothetical protein